MSSRPNAWFALAGGIAMGMLLGAGPLARPALAQASEASAASGPLASRVGVGLAVGGKIGAGIGEPASDFGATPIFELELQYLLPLGEPIGRSFGLFLGAQYAQPGMDGGGDADLRLPGDGELSYELTQRQLTLSLGPLYRFDVGSELVMPYAGIGGRMYLLRTEVNGEVDGASFGDNEETKTGFGLLLLGGAELFVGPGALLAELQLGWGPLDTYVLRDTNLGALALSLGYRLFF
jgi:hypothetical protein